MMKINDSKKAFYSYIGLFFVAMLWGLAFTVVKSTLDYIPPTYMVAIRFTVASIAMCIIFAKKLKRLNKENIIHGFIIGVSLFLAYFAQTKGCAYTTAGKNAFLTALYVMVVPFIHWIMDKKRPEAKLFVTAVIAIVGIGFISLDGDFSIDIGEWLSIACGVLFGLQIAFVDKYSSKDDVLILTIVQVVTCALLGWIVAPFADPKMDMMALVTPEVIKGVLYIGLVSTLVCNLLQNICQKYTKPENASLIMSTESMFGVLGSIVFLHENPSSKMIFGCVLMMLAIFIAQIDFKKINGGTR